MTVALPSAAGGGAAAVQPILEAAVDGSFDAGLLLHGETGAIVHFNEAAATLFGGRAALAQGKSASDLFSFWTYSLPEEKWSDVTDQDTMTWAQVTEWYSQSDAAAAAVDWKVTGKLLGKPHSAAAAANRSFPGILKLVPPLRGDEDCRLWLGFVRHADQNDIMADGGSLSHNLSTHQRHRATRSSAKDGSRGSRNSHCGSQDCVASLNSSNEQADGGGDFFEEDEEAEPKMIMDEHGNILRFNELALENVDWCSQEMVGKHITNVNWTEIQNKIKDNGAGNHHNNSPAKTMEIVLETSQLVTGIPTCTTIPSMTAVPAANGGGALPDPSAMTTMGAQQEENITEAVFEAALNPLFQIDEHGTIQMVNQAAETAFGWSRAEFLGSNISMICGGGHAERHAQYMARYLATGDTRVIGKNRELVAKRKDNSEFPIELGVVEVDTFAGDVRLFCGFVRDLTGVKQQERLTQQIVEVSLDPMFHIDEQGWILMVNQAALTTFGYEREDLVGQNVSMICGGEHGARHESYLSKYLQTGVTKVIGKYRELPARRKDGSEFPIQLAVVELNHGGQGEGRRSFCGFVHDLSSRKRQEALMTGTVDSCLDPILHIDERGIIQMVNAATVQQLGWTKVDLIGQNVNKVVGGEHAANHDNYIQRYLATGEAKAIGKKRHLTARRKDGSEMPIELGLSEIKMIDGKERIFCAFLTKRSSLQ